MIADISVFATETRNNVDVAVNTTVRVDLTLQPGRITETVLVSGAPPELQTERADISTNLESHALENMPVSVNRNSRTLLSYLDM